VVTAVTCTLVPLDTSYPEVYVTDRARSILKRARFVIIANEKIILYPTCARKVNTRAVSLAKGTLEPIHKLAQRVTTVVLTITAEPVITKLVLCVLVQKSSTLKPAANAETEESVILALLGITGTVSLVLVP